MPGLINVLMGKFIILRGLGLNRGECFFHSLTYPLRQPDDASSGNVNLAGFIILDEERPYNLMPGNNMSLRVVSKVGCSSQISVIICMLCVPDIRLSSAFFALLNLK